MLFNILKFMKKAKGTKSTKNEGGTLIEFSLYFLRLCYFLKMLF